MSLILIAYSLYQTLNLTFKADQSIAMAAYYMIKILLLTILTPGTRINNSSIDVKLF